MDAGEAGGEGVGGGGADDAGGDEAVGASVGFDDSEAGFFAAAVDAEDAHGKGSYQPSVVSFQQAKPQGPSLARQRLHFLLFDVEVGVDVLDVVVLFERFRDA